MALVRVRSLPDGDVTVATLAVGSLDESNAEDVGAELYALANRLGEGWLQLDLGEVRTLSSAGLGKLFSVYRKVLLGGGRLTLWNLRPEVYDVFALTRLTNILDVQPAAELAAGVSAPGPRMG